MAKLYAQITSDKDGRIESKGGIRLLHVTLHRGNNIVASIYLTPNNIEITHAEGERVDLNEEGPQNYTRDDDPCLDCDGTGWQEMGASPPAYREPHVERCDTCARFDSDEEAAEAYKKANSTAQ